MVNYQNGKIYKIESLVGQCIYYGSTTTKRLSSRMAEHRHHCKTSYQITSKKVLQYPDAKIYLVELYPCNSKEELNSREGYYIRNNECVNKNIPDRTRQEYMKDNKEMIKCRNKKYYEEHKDRIRNLNVKYRSENKVQIQRSRKKYYDSNQDKIKRLREQNIQCECGKVIRKIKIHRHRKSQKHIDLINNPFLKFYL